ncbi:MAG: histidine kinase, partial [Acidobacteria bacterium]|nr:histidine kinase [Acidobacteriota bacterium]
MFSFLRKVEWRRPALAVVLLWTAYGCLGAFQSHYRSALFGRPISLGSSFRYELSYSLISILLTPAIIRLARRYRFANSHWPRNLLIHCFGMLAFATVAKLLWDLVANPPWSFYRGGASWVNVMKSATLGMDAGFPLYWVVVLSFYSYEYYEGLQRERLAAAELHRQFVNAQLDALKMQLHPHFLFNTLNTISGLIQEDAVCAERMIARLSV